MMTMIRLLSQRCATVVQVADVTAAETTESGRQSDASVGVGVGPAGWHLSDGESTQYNRVIAQLRLLSL